MLEKVSRYIVNFLIDKKVANKDLYEVYLYGAMLFLSNAAGIISIFLISLLFFNIFTFLVFVVVFIPLRLTAGGYHCNQYSTCFIVSNVIFLLTALLAKVTCFFEMFPVFASAVSLVIVIAFSPVENKYNPLSKIMRAINRRKAIILTVLQCILINILNLIQNTNLDYYVCLAACSGLSVNALMIIQIIDERRKKNA